MAGSSCHHEAHDYAERIRERLPRRLQELRESRGLSMYALWLKCGVSRNMISRIESGESVPRCMMGFPFFAPAKGPLISPGALAPSIGTSSEV